MHYKMLLLNKNCFSFLEGLHLSAVHFSEQFHNHINKQIYKPHAVTEWEQNYTGLAKKKFLLNQLLLDSLCELKFSGFSSQIKEI